MQQMQWLTHFTQGRCSVPTKVTILPSCEGPTASPRSLSSDCARAQRDWRNVYSNLYHIFALFFSFSFVPRFMWLKTRYQPVETSLDYIFVCEKRKRIAFIFSVTSCILPMKSRPSPTMHCHVYLPVCQRSWMRTRLEECLALAADCWSPEVDIPAW